MQESSLEQTLSFRQEVLHPIFNLIRGAESGYVISGASMGKTRLVKFMRREDVQKHYVGDTESFPLLVFADPNLISSWQDFGFFEWMLRSLAQACGNSQEFELYHEELADWNSKVILGNSDLLALQYLQRAIQKLSRKHPICFVFEEFDEAYRRISVNVFSKLRSLRDENRGRLCFLLFLRDLPERLRPLKENESFYELYARNVVGLGPYSYPDSLTIIQQLEMRRKLPLRPEQREWIYSVSGGYPGLMQALFYLGGENFILFNWQEDLERICQQNIVHEQCSKLWENLSTDEQHGLIQFIQRQRIEPIFIERLLITKGLLKVVGGKTEIFSPLFRIFLDVVLYSKEQGNLQKRLLKVFLSHSSRDKTFVRTLYRQLCSMSGLAPWLDEVNLLPGEDWHYEITKAIEETDVVIVCVSRNMVSKEGYIQKEIKHALDVADEKPEGSVFIIPVLIESCDIPKRLSKWHWLNYSSEGAFERLMLALQKRAQELSLGFIIS